MRIEEFLREQGWEHGGRIPLAEGSQRDLAYRFFRLGERLGMRGMILFGSPESGLWPAFRELGYRAFEAPLAMYGQIRKWLPFQLRHETAQLLLGLHDSYVTERNLEVQAQASLARRRLGEGAGGACAQCGQCCMGPAKGPLTTSPLDLFLWEELGREDLLYHTERGAWAFSPVREQDFAACPFLRFSSDEKGICLIHPVKPLICLEFSCEETLRFSGSSKGDGPWVSGLPACGGG